MPLSRRHSGSFAAADKFCCLRTPNAPVPCWKILHAFSLDLASICLDEKDLIGSYSSDFTLQDEVARLVFSRRFDVRQLITHRFPLEETAAAVALAANPKPDSLKILVSLLRQ